MMRYQVILIVVMVISHIIMIGPGCGDSDGDNPVDNTTLEETVDWSCAIDPESDVLLADPVTGWMDRCDSTSLIQGEWFEAVDGVSSADVDLSTAGDGEFCVSGSTGPCESNGNPHWGAGMGFYLCHTGDDENLADRYFDMGTCPWDLTGLSGMTATIDGVSDTATLRVVFRERGRVKYAFIEADMSGSPAHFYFDDAEDTDGVGVNEDNIEAIVFQVVGDSDEGYAFDFCVSNVSFY